MEQGTKRKALAIFSGAGGNIGADIVAKVSKLNSEIIRILGMPSAKKRLNAQGIDIMTSTPAQYLDYIKSETVRWAKVVKDSGARLD